MDSFEQHFHLPTLSDGRMFYSSRSRLQKSWTERAVSLVNEAIGIMDISQLSNFVICDYGSADGRNTHSIITACIESIRKCNAPKKIPINIYFEDQCTNDFSSLFKYISDIDQHEDVFFFASGKHFFSQCFPDDTVNFAFSSIAVHWLSKRPCYVSNGLLYFNATHEEKILFQRQAEEDWERFLLLRSKELTKGSHMIIVSICEDNIPGPKFNTIYLLNKMWTRIYEEGLINEGEYKRGTINWYSRTEAEYTKPFLTKDSPVYLSGLRLLSTECKISPYPLKPHWDFTGGDMVCAEECATEYIEDIRAWSTQSIHSAFDDSRSIETKNYITDEYYKICKKQMVQRIQEYIVDMNIIILHLRKL